MKVNGSATLHGPVDEVWARLRDPQVLVRTIPGCERLETIGEDEYRMTVTAGVASIKGTYLGTVRLTDPEPPHSFVLRASGAGNPGTVDAAVTVSLSGEDGDTTRLEYSADAVVGGTIAGVGQRMLTSAAKRTAGEFFRNVDAVLTGGPDEAAPQQATAPAAPIGDTGVAPSAVAEGMTVGAEAGGPHPQAASGGVYEAPRRRVGATGTAAGDLAKGVALGAAAALAGVVVGGLLGRRSGPATRVFSPNVKVRAVPRGRGR